MSTGEWLRLVASLSLSQAELLQQVMDYILISYPVQKEHLETALVTYIIENPSEEWAYNSREENIRSFVKSLPILQEKTENELKDIVNMISEKLIPEEDKNWINRRTRCLILKYSLLIMQVSVCCLRGFSDC